MFSKKTMGSFHSKYEVNESNGCWEWTASNARGGYGQFMTSKIDGRKWYRAHRFSYEVHKGQIPEGFVVAHTCDNPKCVNPDHLFICTQTENIADREDKGRGNWNVRHDSDYLQSEILSSTESDSTLAKRLNCSRAHVWKIKNNLYAWQKNRADRGVSRSC